MRISQPYGRRFDEDTELIEPKYKVYIGCEGKWTEYLYFEGLIRARESLQIDPLIEVIPIKHIKGTSSHPLKIIEGVHEVLTQEMLYIPEDGDTCCIITDRDMHSFSSSQYDEALDLAQTYGFNLVISNPCIELWLLLHFSDLSEYDLEEIRENRKTGKRTYTEKLLKNDHLGGSYSKKRLHFETVYMPHVVTAIKNSKLHATTVTELKERVGTNIGLLIESMRSSFQRSE